MIAIKPFFSLFLVLSTVYQSYSLAPILEDLDNETTEFFNPINESDLKHLVRMKKMTDDESNNIKNEQINLITTTESIENSKDTLKKKEVFNSSEDKNYGSDIATTVSIYENSKIPYENPNKDLTYTDNFDKNELNKNLKDNNSFDGDSDDFEDLNKKKSKFIDLLTQNNNSNGKKSSDDKSTKDKILDDKLDGGKSINNGFSNNNFTDESTKNGLINVSTNKKSINDKSENVDHEHRLKKILPVTSSSKDKSTSILSLIFCFAITWFLI